MRDVLGDLLAWWRAGETVGVGTVVGTWRSAPRQPGAAMLVGPDESAVGSVSGGCVESAVYALAQAVINDGHPVLQRYGVSDNDAFAVGLTCGGILDVFVEKVSQQTFPELADVAADIEAGRPVAVATVVEHPDASRVGRRMIIRPAEDLHRRFARQRAGRRCCCRRCPRPAGHRQDRAADLRSRKGSGAARGCAFSPPATRPARRCWSSGPSTLQLLLPGSEASWATG